MNNKVFLVISQSSYNAGCDYALQTVNFLKKKSAVVFVLFGEPLRWRDFLWSKKRKKIFSKEKNLTIVRPFFFIIGNRFQLIRNINCFINSLFLRLYLQIAYRQKDKHIWFFEPDYADIFLIIFSRFLKIYDCVDFFPFFSEYSKKCHLALARRADIITANSSVIFNEIKKIRNDVKLVPLGFADEIFKKTKPLSKEIEILMKKHKGKTVLGFVGGISSRINFCLLEKVIKLSPSSEFVFFGSLEPAVFGKKDYLAQKIEKLKKLPNFYLYPSVKKQVIPELIKRFTIGLIPYNVKNFYNRYSFPMKSMEYLYVGLPIISTEIEELRKFPKFIYLVKNAEEFTLKIEYLKKYPTSLSQKKEMQKTANSQSWENKIDKILQEIDRYN